MPPENPSAGCRDSVLNNITDAGAARIVLTPDNFTLDIEVTDMPFVGDNQSRDFNSNTVNVAGAFERIWEYMPPDEGQIVEVIWRYPLLPCVSEPLYIFMMREGKGPSVDP